jgi:hypothetical protein
MIKIIPKELVVKSDKMYLMHCPDTEYFLLCGKKGGKYVVEDLDEDVNTKMDDNVFWSFEQYKTHVELNAQGYDDGRVIFECTRKEVKDYMAKCKLADKLRR